MVWCSNIVIEKVYQTNRNIIWKLENLCDVKTVRSKCFQVSKKEVMKTVISGEADHFSFFPFHSDC